jgi:hypothetical protein
METNKMETNKRKPLELILGIILLIPPILSVPLFLLQFVKSDLLKNFLGSSWTGAGSIWESSGGGGGAAYTSALPFYFGLMAIAGVLLIVKSNKVKAM